MESAKHARGKQHDCGALHARGEHARGEHARGVLYTGVPSSEELEKCPGMPSDDIMKTKKIPRIECVQNIPCNPCEGICPTGAIYIGENITDLPVLSPERCTSCGLCVANCPGLAITMIDKSKDDEYAIIDFPFEYLPLPLEGDNVNAVGRDGVVICKGKILKVKKLKAYDFTTVISMKVPMDFADLVVSMERIKR